MYMKNIENLKKFKKVIRKTRNPTNK